ncbi:MAG: 4Fe-4S binding protein [Proteobacteria bacterium]|nr:4Fe-4S binding protein [Pseudomonadota bacterium]
MSDSIYHRLQKRLESYPQGFPDSGNGIEVKIIKKLFTEEQAEIFCEIASTFPLRPTPGKPTSKKLQKKLNMTQEELAEKLESMAQQGLLFRQRNKGNPNDPLYYPPPFVVGLYEFSLKTMDRELATYVNEAFEGVAQWWNKIPTKQLRVVPIENSIKQDKGIWPYDKIEEVIKGHDLISVADCICMKEKQMLGQDCKASLERCISFDWFAEHYIDTGMGRQITEKELREILVMAEKNGLVISPSNITKSIGFCLCCDCCCSWLRVLSLDPKPAMQVTASYRAEIDQEICTQCGVCLKRCNMKAIKQDCFTVDVDRCIGCGLCVTTCPTNAIQMKKNGRTFHMEKSATLLFYKMHEEHVKAKSFGDDKIKNTITLSRIKMAKTFYRTKKLFIK